MLPHLLLQVGFILINALIAFAESAAVSINDTRLEALAAKGNRKARRLTKIINRPASFFKTVRVSICFISFIACITAAEFFVLPLSISLSSLLLKLDIVISVTLAQMISSLIIAFVLTYLHLVFGEIVPKRLGEKNSEKTALNTSGFLMLVYVIFIPFSFLVTISSNLVLRIFGIDPHVHNEKVTEEEIKMMVDEGTEKGTIDKDEKELIENVFEFDNLSASDVATHRTDISFLSLDDSIEEWEKIISETSFSRYPICEENADKIVGILNVREYYKLDDKSKKNVLQNAVRPAYFVPESVKADILFKNMKEKKEVMAVVIDEYGGTAGIITLNDLVSCLVGEFNTEEGPEEDNSPDIEKIDDSLWIIKGTTSTEEVLETLGVPTDGDDSDTISGYALGLYGRIPEDGTTFEIETDELRIRALEIKEHTVEKLEIYVKPTEKSEETDVEEENKE